MLAEAEPALLRAAYQPAPRTVRIGQFAEPVQPFDVLQRLQPVADIGGVVVANLGSDFEIGAEKGDELLFRVAFMARTNETASWYA
jgi:hypothetical protein